ncbi:hypothetical protein [Vibrio harveyi]|uniref:hypothetical protein n=1 Tax=Vibrio harveyi TaxID=669 RepID=UPI0002C48540|nr:hypothetical protein [Vibrio harveyi]EMR38135.1 hypothetical protein MUQ_04603 [Vibrio harveyi CAIM 1792]
MNLIDTIQSHMDEMTKLRITTVVGNTAIDGKVGELTATAPSDGKVFHSTINLVQGDIYTGVPEGYNSAELSAVYEMHKANVDNGQQIIRDNIDTLRALVDLAIEVKDRS